jgi:uncharacterized protein YjiS (DUF1127 family)
MERILSLIYELAASFGSLGTILHRRRMERELHSLSDVMLKDIGVARSEIPWITVTQAKRIRARDSTGNEPPAAGDRAHSRIRTSRLSLLPSRQGAE